MTAERNLRRTMQGRVVSDKMDDHRGVGRNLQKAPAVRKTREVLEKVQGTR